MLACWGVFNLNLRPVGSFDSLAASRIPFQLWHGEGLSLAPWAHLPGGISYSIVLSKGGHWVSRYPIVTPLLVTPLYFPTLFWSRFQARTIAVGLMEKLSASLLAALSVLFVWLVLRRFTSPRRALLLSLVYAFATSTWSISSQALWQHGAAQLLLAAALWLLFAKGGEWRARHGVTLGILAGLLIANRPTGIAFAAALGLIVWLREGRRALAFMVPAAVIGGLLAVYNHVLFGSLFGGYAVDVPASVLPVPARAVALLVGGRGLLLFCPFFLLLLRAPRLPGGRSRGEAWILCGACLALFIFLSAMPFWRGGSCYGPRYLSDGLPILVLLLCAPYEGLALAGRTVFALLVAYGIVVQAIGAFFYPSNGSAAETGAVVSGLSTFQPLIAAAGGPMSPYWLHFFAPRLGHYGPIAPNDGLEPARWLQAPPAVWPGHTLRRVSVQLTNRGNMSWSSLGRVGTYAVRLAVAWRSSDFPVFVQDSDDWLCWSLAPGASLGAAQWLISPAYPGTYEISISPVQWSPRGWRRLQEPARARVQVEASAWPLGIEPLLSRRGLQVH